MKPALALGLALFLPAFGTHGLNATVQALGRQLGLAEGQGLAHGWLMGAFALAALPGYLIAGPLSDRGRRRPLILYGIAGYAVVHLGLMFWEPMAEALGVAPFTLFLVLRLAAGFCGGVVFVTCNALTADLYPPHRRGRAMSLVWLGIPAALVVGVPLTAFLTWIESQRPGLSFWLGQPYALIAVVVSLAAAWTVARAVQDPPAVERTTRYAGSLPRLRTAVVLAPLIALCMPMAVFQLLATVSEFTRQSFGWSELQYAYLFLVLGLSGVAGGILSATVADRLGKARCLLLAQASFAILVWPLPMVSPGVFLLIAGLLSLLSTMRQGPFQAIAAALVERHHRGKLSALILAAGAIGTALGQLLGSAMMAAEGAFSRVVLTCFLVMGVAVLLFLWLRAAENRRGSVEQEPA
jgi:predicted MFS family arabinose efflux permease